MAKFSSPYMNIRGQGRPRNFVIRSLWSDRSTLDWKIPRTAAGRTLGRRLRHNTRAGGGERGAGPFGHGVEEAIVVGRGMGEDLPAQEAIFRGEVAFDVSKAQDAERFLVRQQQRGQAAHRVSDQVETPDARLVQHGLRGLDQERDRYPLRVFTDGLAASWCVVGQERAARERVLACDVEVVLLRRAETVQEH